MDIIRRLIADQNIDASFRRALAVVSGNPMPLPAPAASPARPSMKVYSGRTDQHGTAMVRVTKDGDSHALRPRCDLANHSPTGFSWGYGGSGPAQLALAMLADALGDDKAALRLHQRFKFKVIAAFPKDRPWLFTEKQVMAAVRDIVCNEDGGRTC